MSSTELMEGLMRSALASSAAMVAVFLLRGVVRRRLGASAAYLLWLCVPAVLLAMLLPAPRRIATEMTQVLALPGSATSLAPDPSIPLTGIALCVWLFGAISMAWLLHRQQRRFVAGLGTLQMIPDGLWQASSVHGLPAVIGVLRPRIIVPADFHQRYSVEEQSLVLRHEQIHVRRGDLLVNAFIALLHCVYWFNPLIWLAARRCREDQEFACDERVIAAHNGARRSYASAMLKTELAMSQLPLGCHWQNHHPLKERMIMLKQAVPGRKQWAAMTVLSLALCGGAGYSAWAAQPAVLSVASESAMYEISVEFEVEGQKQRFKVREVAGKPFAFSVVSASGRVWEGDFVIRPLGDGRLNIVTNLRAAGSPVGSPSMVVNTGKPARISVGSGGQNDYALSLDVRRLDGPEQRGAAEMPEASAATGKHSDVGVGFANMSPPRYPVSMNTGKVWLKIDVSAEGAATQVVVDSSSGHEDLDQSAMDAAYKWTFKPAEKGGKQVASQIRVPITFEMDHSESIMVGH